VAAALLAACSGIPLQQRDAARRAQFEAYAGRPVDHFTWLVNYEGWEPISPDQLVVWTDINDAYLVTVFRPCTDLMFSHRIGFTSSGRTVYAHFDAVRVGRWRCMIKTIQPVDYRRMQQDEKRQRQAEAERGKPGT
jgi:hypothetical protein